jgi:hypothetical protein
LSLPLGDRVNAEVVQSDCWTRAPVAPARCASGGESESLSSGRKNIHNVLMTSTFKRKYTSGSGCTVVLFVAETRK